MRLPDLLPVTLLLALAVAPHATRADEDETLARAALAIATFEQICEPMMIERMQDSTLGTALVASISGAMCDCMSAELEALPPARAIAAFSKATRDDALETVLNRCIVRGMKPHIAEVCMAPEPGEAAARPPDPQEAADCSCMQAHVEGLSEDDAIALLVDEAPAQAEALLARCDATP